MNKELERIKTELGALLDMLNAEHTELDKITDELYQWRSEETQTKNNIIDLSKKIKVLQKELEEDFLED